MKYYFLALGALVVVCMGCAGIDGSASVVKSTEHVAPPAAMLQHPGPMVDGPGPGVLGVLAQGGGQMPAALMTTQVKFIGQDGMSVGWLSGNALARNQRFVPGRADFPQGAIYQLVFSNIPGEGWEGQSLYPTLEVRGAHPNTLSYLQHNPVPLEVTEEDLEHIRSNNMVTKVIYLPHPEFQARAIAGVETLVSTTLDPGNDPIQLAEQTGTIMLVLRVGNREMNFDQPAAVPQPDGSNIPVSFTMLDGDQATSGIQAEHLEVFDGVQPVGLAEDVGNPLRGVQHRGLPVGLLRQALGEEKGGPDGGRPGTTDSLQLLEFIEGRPRDGREPTEALHERLGGAGPAEGGEQFRVRCVFNRLHGYLREGQAPDAHLTQEV